jgi:hypothetical protein
MLCCKNGFVLVALAPLALFVLGCGKSDQKTGDTESQRIQSDLTGIYDLYTMYAKTNQKPPQRTTDLTTKEQQAIAPAATRALTSDEYVIVWGADLASKDAAVLAYQKAAPNEGGWVLLRDGTVKQMTVDEFKAAPKAK